MSAPEPQVRVDTREWKGHTEYRWECSECGWQSNEYWVTDPEPLPSVAFHNVNCDSLRLARLQARWDARDEALRGLVEKWRQRADEAAASGDGDDTAAVYYHRYACASELERAIGGGE